VVPVRRQEQRADRAEPPPAQVSGVVARVDGDPERPDQRLLDEREPKRLFVGLPDRRPLAAEGLLGALQPLAAVKRLHPLEVAVPVARPEPVLGEEVVAAAVVQDDDPGPLLRRLVDRAVERVVVADVVDDEVVLPEPVQQRRVAVELERAETGRAVDVVVADPEVDLAALRERGGHVEAVLADRAAGRERREPGDLHDVSVSTTRSQDTSSSSSFARAPAPSRSASDRSSASSSSASAIASCCGATTLPVTPSSTSSCVPPESVHVTTALPA